MLKIAGLFCFSLLLRSESQAQNEFEQYGPAGAKVFTNLKEALREDKKVYKLDLSYQQFDQKSYDKISDLKDLQVLKLGSNQVKNYPNQIEHLSNLLYFASFNNPLEKFLPNLKSYQNLHYLELQHTKIDSIPAQIAYLSRLSSLKFGNTDDTLRLPNTFKYLTKLKDLSFENCILDSFPKQVFQASALKFLYLSNTNTKKLSKHFENLPNLEVLIVENNPLLEVPFDIYKASKLRLISFRSTLISKLPDSISQLEHLTLLDIRGNNFSAEEIDKLKSLLPGCEIKF